MSHSRFLCILNFNYILGAIFQMWKETRTRQMAQFQNLEIGEEHHLDGHGVNTVTPEQVNTSI